jgi:diguanylate cyclase (GGDEF)-like protein
MIEASPIVVGAVDIRVTASFGVASFPEPARSAASLLAAADAALYRAKVAGRNRVRSAAPAR